MSDTRETKIPGSPARRPRTTWKQRMIIYISLLFVLVILPLIVGWIMIAQPTFGKNNPSSLSVSSVELERHVKKLAIDFFSRNDEHPEKLKAAADYILDQFRSTSARIKVQNFTTTTTYSPDGKFRNLSAHFGHVTGTRIVIGAHYDVYSDLPGADDNASAVAGLIELAKLFDQHPPSMAIELVSYPLEEPPYYATNQMGSAFHARALKKAGVDVQLMICLEMIGYFTNKPSSQKYPANFLRLYYPSRGNFIAIASTFQYRKESLAMKKAMRGVTPLPVESINAPRGLPGIDFSDHRNYWAVGYPAVMITDTSFYRNANYHTKNDTPDTLDYEKMSQVVVAVFEAVKAMYK